MTSPKTESQEEERKQRRRRIERRKHQQKIANWVTMPFCVLLVAAIIGFTVQERVDRPRLAAAVTHVLESRGGEVVKIVYSGRRGYGDYVDVMFDGQLNRCDLYLLDESPPVFAAMVRSIEPYWTSKDEPVLGCNPDINR